MLACDINIQQRYKQYKNIPWVQDLNFDFVDDDTDNIINVMFVLLNKMSFPVWTKSAKFLVEKRSDGFAVTTTSSVADLGQIHRNSQK